MLVDKPYDHQVSKRILDYYSRDTPWTRQLWRLSALLELDELLEAAKAQKAGVLSDTAVKYLSHGIVERVKRDPGFGSKRDSGILAGHVSRDLPPGGHNAAALRLLIDQAHETYLLNWAIVIRSSQPPAEMVSRAIGSYLLDIGFSQTSLHKWWTYQISHNPDRMEIADLIEEAASLARRASIRYGALIPVTAMPSLPSSTDENWLTPTRTAEWISHWFPAAAHPRQAGALYVELDARDQYSAVEQVANKVKSLAARFRVGARQRLDFSELMYLIGVDVPFTYSQPPRRVEVHALQRTSSIFDLGLSPELSSVLELLEPLDTGTSAAAIAGSWAALEALFVGPGDTSNRIVAAIRIARIVACSYVRAELTALANAYASERQDALADQLRALPDNLSRAREFENQVRTGTSISYKRTRHRLALARMEQLIARPDEVMPRIIAQLEDSFRRLYRQRNLILHAGDLTSVALSGTLRTVAPLIGAGIDRVIHASAATRTSPLVLAAMAEVNLARVIGGQDRLVDALG